MAKENRSGQWSPRYKALIVMAAVVGILLQCRVGTGQFSLKTFQMFTTLSNLAVAMFYVWYLALHRSGRSLTAAGERLVRYLKFLITMGILLTGLVAHFMLRGMFADLQPMARVGLTLLHYVVPIATFLDWVLFDEKGRTEWKMPLFAAVFPLCYLLGAVIVAQFKTGENRYPYPFLNVDALGVKTVLLTVVLLTLAFLAVGCLGVWIDHAAAKRKRRSGK